jgi:hypothetical protein
MDRVPGQHAEYKREVIDRQVRLMQERGIWKPPASSWRWSGRRLMSETVKYWMRTGYQRSGTISSHTYPACRIRYCIPALWSWSARKI